MVKGSNGSCLICLCWLGAFGVHQVLVVKMVGLNQNIMVLLASQCSSLRHDSLLHHLTFLWYTSNLQGWENPLVLWLRGKIALSLLFLLSLSTFFLSLSLYLYIHMFELMMITSSIMLLDPSFRAIDGGDGKSSIIGGWTLIPNPKCSCS